jgi:heme A synthase
MSVVTDSRSLAGERRFVLYAWSVLAYNVVVILWGAVVRATGSGAGCGEHWPLCQGVVIPHAAQIATLIEFAHRVSSGMAVILVLLLVVFAFRRFTSGHPARRCAAAALLFTLTEGLIGAALVVFGQVGNNASMSRALILSLHLINTFLLLASLTLTAKSAGAARPGAKPLEDVAPAGEARIGNSEPLLLWYAVGLLGALAMAVTGTITALGDTLFHSTSLAQGFELDFSAAASPLLRLRIIHPLIAVAAGGYLILLAVRAVGSPVSPSARRLACWLLALVTFQFLLGLLNLVLLAPLGTQLLHLLTADVIWITLVLLSSEVLGRRHPVKPSANQRHWALQTESQVQPARTNLRSTAAPTKQA